MAEDRMDDDSDAPKGSFSEALTFNSTWLCWNTVALESQSRGIAADELHGCTNFLALMGA
jgi:hypothetical protein